MSLTAAHGSRMLLMRWEWFELSGFVEPLAERKSHNPEVESSNLSKPMREDGSRGAEHTYEAL